MKALRWAEGRRILAIGFSLLATTLAARQSLRLVTPRAEFQVLPSGDILATRLQDGQRLSLDGAKGGAGDSKAHILDLGKAHRSKVGRHWEIPYLGNSPVSKTLILEVRESQPGVLFASLRVTNPTAAGRSTGKLDVLRAQFAKDHLWSFQGASKGWGLDDVMILRPGSHENILGAMVDGGLGGG
ncbi:MAG TPA: hypothetical protein VF518_16460, partial [Polyangia bacterium]